jgi:hypothetical protein
VDCRRLPSRFAALGGPARFTAHDYDSYAVCHYFLDWGVGRFQMSGPVLMWGRLFHEAPLIGVGVMMFQLPPELEVERS